MAEKPQEIRRPNSHRSDSVDTKAPIGPTTQTPPQSPQQGQGTGYPSSQGNALTGAVVHVTASPYSRMEEIHSYLASKGWELMGSNERGQTTWADPVGKSNREPRQVQAAKLPVAGGGHEVVNQWSHPPTNWVYPVDEAMLIQKQRDAKAALVTVSQEE